MDSSPFLSDGLISGVVRRAHPFSRLMISKNHGDRASLDLDDDASDASEFFGTTNETDRLLGSIVGADHDLLCESSCFADWCFRKETPVRKGGERESCCSSCSVVIVPIRRASVCADHLFRQRARMWCSLADDEIDVITAHFRDKTVFAGEVVMLRLSPKRCAFVTHVVDEPDEPSESTRWDFRVLQSQKIRSTVVSLLRYSLFADDTTDDSAAPFDLVVPTTSDENERSWRESLRMLAMIKHCSRRLANLHGSSFPPIPFRFWLRRGPETERGERAWLEK